VSANRSHDFASLTEAWTFYRSALDRGDVTSHPLQQAPYTVRVIESAEERPPFRTDGKPVAFISAYGNGRSGVTMDADEADAWLAIHAPEMCVDRSEPRELRGGERNYGLCWVTIRRSLLAQLTAARRWHGVRGASYAPDAIEAFPGLDRVDDGLEPR